jgi:L-amino acid N-acyltransferase YncA
MRSSQGTGTALLGAAVRELLALGYSQLLSTFMLGNDSSMLWHWRSGFELLAHPGSFRRLRSRWKRRVENP